MRFTNSKDGKARADMRITIRVGRDLLVATACYYANREGLDEMPQNPSRTWFWEHVREVVTQKGVEAAYYWTDDAEEDEDEITAWAAAAVNGAFPELVES